MTLVVNAPVNFTLSATPSSRTIAKGSDASYAVTVPARYFFQGTVNLTIERRSAIRVGVREFRPNPVPAECRKLDAVNQQATRTWRPADLQHDDQRHQRWRRALGGCDVGRSIRPHANLPRAQICLLRSGSAAQAAVRHGRWRKRLTCDAAAAGSERRDLRCAFRSG